MSETNPAEVPTELTPPRGVVIPQGSDDQPDFLSAPETAVSLELPVIAAQPAPPLAMLDSVTVVWANGDRDNTTAQGIVVGFYDNDDNLDIEVNVEGNLVVLYAVPAERAGVSPYYVR